MGRARTSAQCSRRSRSRALGGHHGRTIPRVARMRHVSLSSETEWPSAVHLRIKDSPSGPNRIAACRKQDVVAAIGSHSGRGEYRSQREVRLRTNRSVAVFAGCAIAAPPELEPPDPRIASNVAAVDFNSTRRCINGPPEKCYCRILVIGSPTRSRRLATGITPSDIRSARILAIRRRPVCWGAGSA